MRKPELDEDLLIQEGLEEIRQEAEEDRIIDARDRMEYEILMDTYHSVNEDFDYEDDPGDYYDEGDDYYNEYYMFDVGEELAFDLLLLGKPWTPGI